ncbi:MAG TPA: hydrogenase maturation protease [Microscillaceae bacterium]|nr:hydrogenase maturation protease [Microscillaceae bacterium]
MSKTAIMGFGNPVRSDDVAGVYVIEVLRKQLPAHPQITLLDMGTSAFETLFQLKGHQRIIIVDAVTNSGEPVGTIFKLPAEAIEAQIQDDPLVFLHSLKWDQALSYAKKILQSDYPKDIQVYLIAVDNIKLELSLSPEVKAAAEVVAEKIYAEVIEQEPAS